MDVLKVATFFLWLKNTDAHWLEIQAGCFPQNSGWKVHDVVINSKGPLIIWFFIAFFDTFSSKYYGRVLFYNPPPTSASTYGEKQSEFSFPFEVSWSWWSQSNPYLLCPYPFEASLSFTLSYVRQSYCKIMQHRHQKVYYLDCSYQIHVRSNHRFLLVILCTSMVLT